jgi:hypothetical protein
VFGPLSLADGYYGETLNLDMTVYVPWSAPPCPTLTVTTYVGELAQFIRDSASFTASRYNSNARQCIYEVRRSATLSPDAVGLWYDEARARDKTVAIKVSFSHPASEVVIYRADISGRRFAENYIDKNNSERWRSLVLRGFFSQTARYCGVGRAPWVNYTLVLVNIETYSRASEAADYLAVVTGASSDFVVKEVLFRVRPARAFRGVDSVYVKGDAYQEPWWVTWAFRLAQSVKTALDFFDRIPGPVGWFIDMVFGLRSLSNPDIRTLTTTDYVEVYWRAGLFDMFRQVAFEIGVSQIDRTIEIDYARVATDYAHLCVGYVASPMPAVVTRDPDPDQQLVRHWVFGMRVLYDVPFIRR